MDPKRKHSPHHTHHAVSAKAIRSKGQAHLNTVEIDNARGHSGNLDIASTAASSKRLTPRNKHKKQKEPSAHRKGLESETEPDEKQILALCNYITEDFWEEAWELCSTRFMAQKAPDFITCELRDTWLTILDMQYQDTEPALLDPITISEPIDDVPPLPPKLDSWSRGVLEPLPRTCRESVLDPFLRDPFLWNMEKLQGKNDELLTKQRMFPVNYTESVDTMTKESQEDFELGVEYGHYEADGRNLVRPTSPVPSEADSGWSLISEKNLNNISTKTSLRLTKTKSSTKKILDKNLSAEILYPLETPLPEIKESFQIQRNMSEDVLWKEWEEKPTPPVAFKHPRQTSSDAINTMAELHHVKENVRFEEPVKVESTSKIHSSFSRIYNSRRPTGRVHNNTAVPSKLAKSTSTLSQVESEELKDIAKKHIS